MSQRARDVWPFAMLGVLGIALVPFGGPVVDRWDYIAGAGLTAAVGLCALFAPWARLPRDAPVVPALAYLLAVGCCAMPPKGRAAR